jgi:hypothetical protein
MGTNDGTGTSAQFHSPFGVALNSTGTILYVADQNNQAIRAITLSSGAVVTLAGTIGVVGSTDDPANALHAQFNTPKGIAVDTNGNVYVADTGNFTVRKIAASGGVSTIAGLVSVNGFADGMGSAARFSQLNPASPFGGPCGLAVDGNDNVYVTDQGNHLIRKITAAGNVTTLAGLAQTSGSTDGAGNVARFNFPGGVAMDNSGTLYVADTANHTIRCGVNASTNNSCLTFTAPTNKMVACGSAWDFDAPTNIVDACCTNFAVVFNTVTNELFPLVVVRTWWINDSCGNSAKCSQTVTLGGGKPPVIACPTNTIIVALNAKCQLVIPTIQPVATDDVTPVEQLSYFQDPAAGTIVPGPCQSVTVIVQDACGNVSQCQVQVCGQDKTPPTIIAPKAIPLTNCVVPDVTAFVSASDPCTPANKLIFSQSPPAGTPIAPGVHQVSVTATDPSGNATTVIIPLTSTGPQSFLNALFNTGVDANRMILPGDSVDPHYTLGPVPSGTPTGAGYYNAPNAIVANAPPFTLSQWIDPGSYAYGTSFPAGNYTYTNQFTLPSGTDPTSASISGRWMADNGATMYLNGLTPANQVAFMPLGGYYQWTYFTINSNFLAYPAVNRLYFVVTNYSPGATLLRVEFTDASINCGTCTPPTILQTTPDQSRSLNSTAVFHATLGGTPPFTIVWYHNGQQVVDGGHYSGSTTPTLTVTPLSYADAGTYSADVYGACGKAASMPSKLTVTSGWGPWPWAWWNFYDPVNPLVATVGPNLVFTGTTLFGFVAGTTFDFGLPNIGGQSANVLDVPAMLPAGTYLQLPSIEWTDGSAASNYTLIADVYMPSNSTTRSTIMSIFDRWGNLFVTATPSGTLNISGMLGDENINQDYSMALVPNAWNRVALAIDTTTSATESNRVALMISCNGMILNNFYGDIPSGSATTFMATVGTSPNNGTNGEIYLSSIQFQGTAFTPEMLAGLGSPDTGPLIANDTSVGKTPMMSAGVSGGMVNFMWSGSAFILQETTDLSSGTWMNSTLPFDEQTDVSGKAMTTAHADPTMEGPAKYYRLIYKP